MSESTDISKNNMPFETGLIALLTIGLARLLYHFRHLPFLTKYLQLMVALLLIYVPILHQRVRHLSANYFEKNWGGLLHSLKIFGFASLLLFPPFLLASHFYQTLLLHHSLHFRLLSDSGFFMLAQMMLVAFPEEFFFRGWLQPFFSKRFGGTGGIFAVALFFAFSHSLIAWQWWHFAIFFPACVFGWLREKTGAITASILFHAVSNVLVAWVGGCYW